MPFELPSKAKVGYLDPEIAGEGLKVILSDGDQVSWTPPPAKPVMPDWSTIKSIRHYFNRTGYQVFPAWLYHPTEEPRLVKNADEAAELGVCYREANNDERSRYGLKAVWDWQDDSKWRPQPYEGRIKFDPMKPGTGKTYMATQQSPGAAQHQLLEAIIPAVAAAVAKSLQANGPAAPASIAPGDWEEFLKFKAWQQATATVDAVTSEASENGSPGGGEGTPPTAATSATANALAAQLSDVGETKAA